MLKIITENNITWMEIETPLQCNPYACSLQLSFFSPVPTGGTEITIQGSGLSSMESVRIGDVPVTYTNSSDKEIKVVLPPRPAGAYSVQLLGPSGVGVNRWVHEVDLMQGYHLKCLLRRVLPSVYCKPTCICDDLILLWTGLWWLHKSVDSLEKTYQRHFMTCLRQEVFVMKRLSWTSQSLWNCIVSWNNA